MSRSVPSATRAPPFPSVRLSLARHSWLALTPSRNLFASPTWYQLMVLGSRSDRCSASSLAGSAIRISRSPLEKAARVSAAGCGEGNRGSGGARPVGRQLSAAHPRPIPHAARGEQRALCSASRAPLSRGVKPVGNRPSSGSRARVRGRVSALLNPLGRLFRFSSVCRVNASQRVAWRRRRRRSTDRRHPRDAAPTDGCHGARRRDHLTHGNDSRLVGGIVSRLA